MTTEQHERVVDDDRIINWGKLCCTECDEAIAFLPPEVRFFGEEIPMYCFQCAVHLDVKDN